MTFYITKKTPNGRAVTIHDGMALKTAFYILKDIQTSYSKANSDYGAPHFQDDGRTLIAYDGGDRIEYRIGETESPEGFIL